MKLAILTVLAASVLALQMSPPFAQSVADDGFRAVSFREVSELPRAIEPEYRDLFEDARAAEVETPKFLIATQDHSENDEKFTEAFVRVKSSLTCAASGQCQIDFFFVQNDKAIRLLSVVAENIGVFVRRQKQEKGPTRPIIITNFPLTETAIRSLKGNQEPVKYTGGTLWTWDAQADTFNPLR
jgi:hypothetical protein